MSQTPNEDQQATLEPKVYFRDIAPFIELACWTVLVLAPILRWINGPPVSIDQLVIQLTLIGLAASGAIGLRLYGLRIRRSSK